MSKQPHLEPVSLIYSKVALKPPFKAESETINCPLPMVARYGSVHVKDWCHGWAMKNELCHFAGDCHAYLDLLIRRVRNGEPLDAKVVAQLGLNVEILKRARR